VVDDIENGLERAAMLVDLQRFDEAVSLLADLLARDPERCRTWCLLTQAHLGAQSRARALEASRQAVRIGPDDEWAHRLKCSAHLLSNQYEEAVREAREAVRLAPHNWQCHTNLARSLVRLGSPFDEAWAEAQEARNLAPLRADAHVTVGIVAAAAGHRADAEAAFLRALAIDPNNRSAHHELARVQATKHSRVNPLVLALSASGFATSVRLDPRSDVGRRNLEVVLWTFLGRLFVPVTLSAFLTVELSSGSLASRLVPLVLVALPIVFAAVFLRNVTPDVRRYLWREIVHGAVRIAVLLEVVAAGTLVAAAFAPTSVRVGLGFAAWGAALGARLVVIGMSRR